MALFAIKELPAVTVLPLLMEPDRPEGRKLLYTGWRRENGILTRCRLDDVHGALVQHVVVRYYVHGIQRQVIAQEIGYSPRQVQAWLGGTASSTYGQPVRDALANLGIGLNRAGSADYDPTSRRLREIVGAQARLLDDAAGLLGRDVRPGAVQVRLLARLLTAGREPLTMGGY